MGMLLGTAVFAQSARADDEFIRINHANWTFAPAFAGQRAVAFLAWDTSGCSAPGNIKLMMFLSANDDHWSSYAWTSGTIGGAVVTARAMMSDESAFSEDGSLVVEACNAEPLPLPEPVTQGMLESDPIVGFVQELEGCEEASEYVGWLAESGYPVAMSLSAELAIGIVGCGQVQIDVQDSLLADTAHRAELARFAASSTPVPVCGNGQWCSCTITYTGWTVTPPGTWTVTSVTVGNSKTCTYRRPAKYTLTRTGKYFLCPSCAYSGLEDGHEFGQETVLAGDPCPASPSVPSWIPAPMP